MNWRTLHTVNYPTDAHVIKSQLESEDIVVFLKDEVSASLGGFLNADIGGVKIQVLEKDFKKAYELLTDWKYISGREERYPFFSEINKLTKKIPFVKKFSFEVRLTLIVAVTIIIFILLTLVSYNSSSFY